MYGRESNCAAILNSGKSKLAAILTSGKSKLPLYYVAAIQIVPLFNIAESHILLRQVKFENFEKLSWLLMSQSNKNTALGEP